MGQNSSLSKWNSLAIINLVLESEDADDYVPSFISSLNARSCSVEKALIPHKFSVTSKTHNECYKQACVHSSLGTIEPNTHWQLVSLYQSHSILYYQFSLTIFLKLIVTAVCHTLIVFFLEKESLDDCEHFGYIESLTLNNTIQIHSKTTTRIRVSWAV